MHPWAYSSNRYHPQASIHIPSRSLASLLTLYIVSMSAEANELLICPYDPVHRVAAKRFPYHLQKCRKVRKERYNSLLKPSKLSAHTREIFPMVSPTGNITKRFGNHSKSRVRNLLRVFNCAVVVVIKHRVCWVFVTCFHFEFVYSNTPVKVGLTVHSMLDTRSRERSLITMCQFARTR